jgi:hypothetical protein
MAKDRGTMADHGHGYGDGHRQCQRSALEGALEVFGLEVAVETDPVHGSIWQAFATAIKRQGTDERLEQAGDIATADAKARWYGEPQSQITKAQGRGHRRPGQLPGEHAERTSGVQQHAHREDRWRTGGA